jgi:Baseplate J-like protein
MIAISTLLSTVTADQFRSRMVTSLQTLGIPAQSWRKGGVASSILTVVSMVLASLSAGLASILSGFFLPTATGDGLTLLAYYVYGVTRPAATAATGLLTFTNNGGGVFNGSSYAPGLVFFLGENGQTYTNLDQVTLGALGSSTATQTIHIECTQLGTIGNAGPGVIDELVTTMVGVSVTNGPVAGQDALDDPTLRSLCLASLGARSVRGPRTAYAYAIKGTDLFGNPLATNAVTGAAVTINRWSISADSHTGDVSIVLASPSGAPDPNDVAGVATSIEANARPDAVTVTLFSAVPEPYTPSIIVWCQAPTAVEASAIQTSVSDAITTYLESYPIGGVTAADDANPSFTGLYASGIDGAVAAGCAAAGATLVSVQGATDLALVSTEVATDAVTSITVRLVPVTS